MIGSGHFSFRPEQEAEFRLENLTMSMHRFTKTRREWYVPRLFPLPF